MTASKAQPNKGPHIKWKRVPGGGILLNLRTGDYFELDETAVAIWRMLDGKNSVAKIARKLANSYAVEEKSLEKDITRFVSELRKRKLIDTVKR